MVGFRSPHRAKVRNGAKEPGYPTIGHYDYGNTAFDRTSIYNAKRGRHDFPDLKPPVRSRRQHIKKQNNTLVVIFFFGMEPDEPLCW